MGSVLASVDCAHQKHIGAMTDGGIDCPVLPVDAYPGSAEFRMTAVGQSSATSVRAHLSRLILSMSQQIYPYLEYVALTIAPLTAPQRSSRTHWRASAGTAGAFRHEQKGGHTAAILTGLDATTATFVAWPDTGDESFPRQWRI
jgi:hypothetical protein